MLHLRTNLTGTLNRGKFTRIGDGFWRGLKQWDYTRVSAVIIAQNINPWTIFNFDENQVRIFYNPKAKFSAEKTPLKKLASCHVNENGEIIFNPGKIALEILNLPFCWNIKTV